MEPRAERRAKLLAALKEALMEDPLPYVVTAVADGFEAMNVRIAVGVLRQGDPTPMVLNRIQQSDMAGIALSSLGQKFGALLTQLAQPRTRRPPQGGCPPRRK